jgi:ATP-dependent Clp protease ATP-binding subunit ClpB
VTFHPLFREHIQEIVRIQLERVQALVQAQGFSLEVSQEAEQYLADQGYDPDYGARPLKRTIQKQLQDPLALAILSGDFVVGDMIRVGMESDELVFQRGLEKETERI